MLTYLWIALGGALGSVARFALSGVLARLFGETFPVGTLFVNVTGSFVIGAVAGLTGPDGRWLAPAAFRSFFLIGVCGGYTTFSSWSLQTLNLARDSEWLLACLNAILSLGLCLVAVWLGHLIALRLNGGIRP